MKKKIISVPGQEAQPFHPKSGHPVFRPSTTFDAHRRSACSHTSFTSLPENLHARPHPNTRWCQGDVMMMSWWRHHDDAMPWWHHADVMQMSWWWHDDVKEVRRFRTSRKWGGGGVLSIFTLRTRPLVLPPHPRWVGVHIGRQFSDALVCRGDRKEWRHRIGWTPHHPITILHLITHWIVTSSLCKAHRSGNLSSLPFIQAHTINHRHSARCNSYSVLEEYVFDTVTAIHPFLSPLWGGEVVPKEGRIQILLPIGRCHYHHLGTLLEAVHLTHTYDTHDGRAFGFPPSPLSSSII